MRTCSNLVISLLLQKSLRDAVLPGDREGETEKFQKVRKKQKLVFHQRSAAQLKQTGIQPDV